MRDGRKREEEEHTSPGKPGLFPGASAALEPRKRALWRAVGERAGEMLLNIEARIGELARGMPRGDTTAKKHLGQREPDPLKHEKIGITPIQMKHAEAIHRNPAAVAAVIAEAKKNKDIPTKTAVLNPIRWRS